MTTNEAFAELINNRELFMSLEKATASNYRQLKKRFINNDSLLTIQTKIQWLERAGYTYKISWIKSKTT